MDQDQVLYARAELEGYVFTAALRHLGTANIEASEEFAKGRVFDIFNYQEDKKDIIQHLLFMSERIRGFVAEGRLDKAMRWLSFVQGCLWVLGIISIHDGQEQNRKH
mgnify:CR=1 FL=1